MNTRTAQGVGERGHVRGDEVGHNSGDDCAHDLAQYHQSRGEHGGEEGPDPYRNQQGSKVEKEGGGGRYTLAALELEKHGVVMASHRQDATDGGARLRVHAEGQGHIPAYEERRRPLQHVACQHQHGQGLGVGGPVGVHSPHVGGAVVEDVLPGKALDDHVGGGECAQKITGDGYRYIRAYLAVHGYLSRDTPTCWWKSS